MRLSKPRQRGQNDEQTTGGRQNTYNTKRIDEIKLAENPKLGFYFSEDEINTLAEYILTVKSLKIPENKQIEKED